MATGPLRVAALNRRFREGVASSNLTRAGLLVHQFDAEEDESHPWRGCPKPRTDTRGVGNQCPQFGGRFSSSVVNARMRGRSGKGGIRLFSARSGVVFNPREARLNCAYAGDSGSRKWPATGCSDVLCASASDGWCGGLAHKPEQLELVIRSTQGGAYNEVMVDTARLETALPRAIDAIFYVRGAPGAERKHAAWAHARFLESYSGLTALEWPLLRLDLEDMVNPLSAEWELT